MVKLKIQYGIKYVILCLYILFDFINILHEKSYKILNNFIYFLNDILKIHLTNERDQLKLRALNEKLIHFELQ